MSDQIETEGGIVFLSDGEGKCYSQMGRKNTKALEFYDANDKLLGTLDWESNISNTWQFISGMLY